MLLKSKKILKNVVIRLKEDGHKKSIKDFSKLLSYTEKIGARYMITLELGRALRQDHMHKNSSVSYAKKGKFRTRK